MIKLPTQTDYSEFMTSFTKRMNNEFPGVCFYSFGSINNHEIGNPDGINYGRSDIDGGLIVDSGTITDKEELVALADLFHSAMSGKNLQTQFNLLDRESSRDGRFLSYSEDYTDWFKEFAKISSGPDYVQEMNGIDFKSAMLYSASFNFCGPGNSIRGAMLYSRLKASRDTDDFILGTAKAIEKVAKLPKKFMWLRSSGLVVPSRLQAREQLEGMLDGVNYDTLDKMNAFLSDPQKLYSHLENFDDAQSLLCESLDCAEQMVSSYIHKFPEPNDREYRV